MTILASKLNPRTDEFRAAAENMRALVADLKAQVTRMGEGGGAAAREKHTARASSPASAGWPAASA